MRGCGGIAKEARERATRQLLAEVVSRARMGEPLAVAAEIAQRARWLGWASLPVR